MEQADLIARIRPHLNDEDGYNKAMQKASIKLYDVYISLYINNNTQETLAYDWGVSSEYIKMLNKSLYEFLQEQLT